MGGSRCKTNKNKKAACGANCDINVYKYTGPRKDTPTNHKNISLNKLKI
jgi:hypothetical protein